MRYLAWLTASFLAAGCASSLSEAEISTGDDGAAGPDPATEREALPLLSTACTARGPKAERCLSERACVGGDADACLAAAADWKEAGGSGLPWARIFDRRACAGGVAEGCKAVASSLEAEDGERALLAARRYFGKCCDLGDQECCDRAGAPMPAVATTEPEPGPAPEPEVAPEAAPAIDAPLVVPARDEEREFEIFLDGDRVRARGLPAISGNGKRMAHLMVIDAAKGKGRFASLVILDAGRDRVEMEKIILEEDESPAAIGAELQERIDEANGQLDLTDWRSMETATQGAEALADCAHLEDTEAGEVCVQKLTVGDRSVRYAEPFFTVGDVESKKGAWSVEGCKGQAYLATVAAGPAGRMLLVEIRYRRADGCGAQAPALHAVKAE
jgi:hypothetical protein